MRLNLSLWRGGLKGSRVQMDGWNSTEEQDTEIPNKTSDSGRWGYQKNQKSQHVKEDMAKAARSLLEQWER